VSAVTGGSINVGSILTTVLPILGKLQSGVTSGVVVTAGETGPTLTTNPAGPQPSLTLDTLLRLKINATVPSLPSYLNDDGTTMTPYDGAVVIGGALADPQGFVPLGLTAGTPATTGGTMIANPTTMAPGPLPMNMAPAHGGLETAPYVALTLGAALSNLLGGLTGGGSSSDLNKSLVLSGNVVFPGPLTYSPTAYTPVTMGSSFLAVQNGTTIGEMSRTVNFTGEVAGATFHRVDIGSGANEWYIYFPPNTEGPYSITVPVPPTVNGTPLPDYFLPPTGSTSAPGIAVQTLVLGVPGTGNLTYDNVVSFSSTTVDDLTQVTSQFSARTLCREPTVCTAVDKPND